MTNLDTSMNPMEETRVIKKYLDSIKELSKRFHFNQEEIECLTLIFHKLSKVEQDLDRNMTKVVFRNVLHSGFNMTDDFLMERIFMALEQQYGTIHARLVSLETWVFAMSLFLRGSLEEKINHCYAVYTAMTPEGVLGRESLFHLMRGSIISSGSDDDPEESIKDLLEILTKKMDLDRDGKISFNDYRQSVLKNPALLECFGQCLPDRIATHAFSCTVFPEHRL